MEAIKKLIMFFVLAAMVSALSGQQSDSKLQAAFAESYKSETSGNYSLSISQMMTIYQADSYAINVRIGWLSLLARQYTESVSYYEKAIRLKPYAIEAKFGMIKALNALESWDKVKEQYEAILRIDGQNTTALYWLGVLLYNRKEYDSAAKNFEKIVNLYPMDYGSVIMLAWTKLFQGKNADARVLFNHALVLSPNDNSAITGLGQIK